jgi:hypothetical protein
MASGNDTVLRYLSFLFCITPFPYARLAGIKYDRSFVCLVVLYVPSYLSTCLTHHSYLIVCWSIGTVSILAQRTDSLQIDGTKSIITQAINAR